MERFIRSLSIRKRDCPKNVEIGDSNKPQSWLDDQKRVRDSSCSFPVESKSKCKKSVLYISGDAIRVIDEANKVLLVDQTLEKVSFCAPDRNIYEGFAYICRDATAKRWLCHGFLATKDSGERLSHALGCAFAVCLERKQAREKQKTQVTSSSSFQTSLMSDKIRNEDFQFSSSKQFFRQASLLERISDPQIAIVTEPVPNKPMVRNKFEVKRPRPSSDFFKRQHSLQLHSNSENCRKSEINFSSSCYVEDGDVFTIYEESVNNNIKDSVGDDNNNANSGSLLHSSFSKEGGRTMNEINNFGAETFSDSTTEFTQASTTNFASGGKQFSPSSHEISNSTRKLSEAESWLNNIAESLSLYTCSAAFNQPIQSHPENGSSTFHKGCSFFLSTSNPFSCGTAFDNSIPYKSQVSLQENSLATLGGRANPFL